MDNDAVLLTRLTFLRNEIAYLKQERDNLSSFQDYTDNIRLKRAVERSLHLAVESCLDLGRRIIAREGFSFAENNREVFQTLVKEGVVPAEQLPMLVNMASFRNLIVHDYVRVDDTQIYVILIKHLADLEAFAKAIQRYITTS